MLAPGSETVLLRTEWRLRIVMANNKKQMAEGFIHEDSIIVKFKTDLKPPIGFMEKRKGYEFNTLTVKTVNACPNFEALY